MKEQTIKKQTKSLWNKFKGVAWWPVSVCFGMRLYSAACRKFLDE